MCNDEILRPNAVMKKVITDRVYLCIFALRNININDDIVYDYGPDYERNMLWRYERKKRNPVIAPVEELCAYIKIEDVHSKFRPYLQTFDSIPTLDLTGDLTQGIFRVHKRPKTVNLEKTIKNGQPGFCERCCSRYDDLKEHLTGFQHMMFKITTANFTKLDAAIAEFPLLVEIVTLRKAANEDLPVDAAVSTSAASENKICLKLLVDYSDSEVSCSQLASHACMFGFPFL